MSYNICKQCSGMNLREDAADICVDCERKSKAKPAPEQPPRKRMPLGLAAMAVALGALGSIPMERRRQCAKRLTGGARCKNQTGKEAYCEECRE